MARTAPLAEISLKYVELTCSATAGNFRREALRGGAVTVVFHFPRVANEKLIALSSLKSSPQIQE